MTFIYLGILLFAGPHLFSSLAAPVRNRLMAWTGEAKYKGAYCLVSLFGVVLMAVGYVGSVGASENFYEPLPVARHVTMLLVLLGFILLSAPYGKSHIRKWVQNPFSLGIVFWATGHLLANGEKPLVWIFGTLLLVAAIDIVRNMMAGHKPSFVPVWKSDYLAVGVGVGLYALALLLFHPYVLGVPVLR